MKLAQIRAWALEAGLIVARAIPEGVEPAPDAPLPKLCRGDGDSTCHQTPRTSAG